LRTITGMIGAFPVMQKYDQTTALGMVGAYLSTARERPHWAIVKAAAMIRSGNAGLNPGFCPSEPEFNILVGRLVEPYLEALRRAERLLTAKIEPSAQPEPRLPEAKSPPATISDGKHASRVMAELAARKAHRGAPQLGSGE